MYPKNLCAAVLLALSGFAAADESPADKSRVVNYQCDQWPQLQVSYAADGAQASVVLPSGKALVLPAKAIASGFLYETPQHSLRGKGDEVTFTIGRRMPMHCRSGGSGADVQKSRWELQNTYWRLRSLNGQPVLLAEQQREPHFVLSGKEGRMHGFAGCNRMMGGYESSGDKLKFKGVATTMMACPTGMETEAAFGKALQQTVRFRIEGADLQLFDAEGKQLAQLEATALK